MGVVGQPVSARLSMPWRFWSKSRHESRDVVSSSNVLSLSYEQASSLEPAQSKKGSGVGLLGPKHRAAGTHSNTSLRPVLPGTPLPSTQEHHEAYIRCARLVLTSELDGVSTGSPLTAGYQLSMLFSVCRSRCPCLVCRRVCSIHGRLPPTLRDAGE